MSNKMTSDKKEVFSFKPIFVAIGTYLLFLLIVFFIGLLLSSAYTSTQNIMKLLVTVVEILIFSGIASLFIKKEKPFLSLIIGIVLTTLIHVPDIYAQVVSYKTDLFVAESSNIEKEFPFLVQVARENVSKGFVSYLLSWFFNESNFIPILLNSVFLINYKKSMLKGERWSRSIFSIFKAFIPLLGIIGYFMIILGLSSNLNSSDSALLNIGAQLLLLNVYLLTRLRKSQIEKQREKLKEKGSRYIIAPLILLSILTMQEIYLLFTNSFPFSLINILTIILFGASIYFLFKKILTGIYIGAGAVIVWCVERIITSNFVANEALAKGIPILSVLLTITVLLLLLNLYLLYRDMKAKREDKGKTLKEIFEPTSDRENTKGKDKTDFKINSTRENEIFLPRKQDNRLIFWMLGISLFFLIWVVIFTLLGFKVNKEYFSYDENICVEDRWEGDKYHKGIGDCVYWARYYDLTKDRDLESEWNNNQNSLINCPAGCEKGLSYKDFRSFTDYWEYSNSCEDSSVICNFSDYVDYIHYSNQDYLKSKDRDIFLNQCIEENCKRPSLFIVK